MIYDCFPFFNELELLELRLHELDGIVDKFVLVEATRTQTGLPKPLYFAENRARFAAFAERIIHVVVDDMPPGDGPRAHWVRERHQRNAIARGLVNCRPQDIIMVSDLDEIPNVQTLARFFADFPYREDALSNFLHAAFNARFTRFLFHRKTLRRVLRKHHPFVWKLEQYPCCYYLNRRTHEVKWWYGTSIMHFRDFSIADEMRYSGYKIMRNGGWHFGYMGGDNRIKTKVAAIAEQDNNTPAGIEKILGRTTMEKVAEELAQGTIDLLPTEEMPRFVTAHPEKFSSWLIDPKQLPRRH